MSTILGKSLANIKKVVITTNETTPKTYTWETASKADIAPVVSEGSETTLRVKNTILATNKFEDIVTGYGLTLEDNTLASEVFALVDGGTVTYDDVDTDLVVGYSAPVAGQAVARTTFDLDIYTEEKDLDGETIGYAKFSFPTCKGRPAEFSITDGEFMVPKLTLVSRPASGTSPVEIEFMETLA